MKKVSLLLALILLCSSMLLTFTSCDKEPDALEIYSKIDEYMSSLDSYKMTAQIHFTTYIEGNKLETVGDTSFLFAGIGSDDPYYYSIAEVCVSAEELDYYEEMVMVEAYNDGVYYLRDSSAGYEEKLCGDMSAADFLAYMDSEYDSDIDFSDCDKIVLNETSVGSNVLQFSGYSKETLKKITDDYGVDEDTFGFKIKDAKVTLVYDDEYRVKSISFTFSFDTPAEEKNVPIFTIWASYSNYNNVERTDMFIKPTSFDKIENVKVANSIHKTLKNLSDANEGKFTLKIDQSISYAGQKTTYKETDTIKFGVKSDGFYFDIDADINGTDVSLKYENGEASATGVDESATLAIDSDKSAKAYIESLINSQKFDRMNVSKITEIGDGIYELESTPIYPELEYAFALNAYELIYKSSSHTLKAYFSEDGRLEKIESTLEILGRLDEEYSGGNVKIVIQTTTTYE